MANITPLTLLFEFLSPLIVTLFYLVFFRKRKNRFIEAFIILMYVKMVTSFLYYIWYLPQFVPGTFDAGIDGTGLSWLLVTDLFFQFTYTLQEYLTWIMVSFFAVLFGMLVLAVKLTLQDPLKMRFSNVIRRITRREPESDGFSGLRDRVNNLRFEGVEPQPLDPEVQSRAWREAWRDYLIIGLATLLPSIGAYLGSVEDYIRYISGDLAAAPNTYVLGVLIFLTWIYRFGYPASNRIAKGAGTKLGDRDIGSEMMRGVLGWFFRLNILLSIYFIITNFMAALGSGQPEALLLLSQYYIDGLVQASPPILFAIILLPLTEDFAVILYKKTFDAITRTKEMITRFNVRSALTNLGAAVGTGGLVAGAFVGAVMAVTLHFAHSQMGGAFLIYPGSVATTASTALDFPSNNLALMPPTIWILMMLAIPLASMLLIGVLGHVVRTKIRGGLEGFALFAGITVSVATWQILPGMDFVLGFAPTPANLAGSLFYRIRPVFEIPSAELILYRLAYQFIVNLPIYVFSALFILYFFEYRRKWRAQTGEESGPLLNIHASDIYQAAGMFVGGLVVAVIGVLFLSFMIDPAILAPTIGGLFAEIANPNGLELVLQHFV
ncbi:MAG: hypothetical protein ACFFAY_13905, partial [Promethearchaeota archaeon]